MLGIHGTRNVGVLTPPHPPHSSPRCLASRSLVPCSIGSTTRFIGSGPLTSGNTCMSLLDKHGRWAHDEGVTTNSHHKGVPMTTNRLANAEKSWAYWSKKLIRASHDNYAHWTLNDRMSAQSAQDAVKAARAEAKLHQAR